MAEYISTVVAPGYERWVIRLGAVQVCIIDKPRNVTDSAAALAHRWLTGDALPDGVRVWPSPRMGYAGPDPGGPDVIVPADWLADMGGRDQ